MPTVRILIGVLPASLHTVVTEAVRSQADMTVVGAAAQHTEMLLQAGSLHPDLVLLAMAGDELPGIVSHLFDQYPHLAILAVAADGREGLLCTLQPHVARLPTATPEALVRTIRTAVVADDADGRDDTGSPPW